MARTSRTHPLQIAEVRAAGAQGRIGITFCPGKVDPAPFTPGGAWQRDLALDLDAIGAWGAAAVVTLVEEHELALLQVGALGREVVRRHMEWLHLPIRDVSAPGPDFEAEWALRSEGLRARLRDGFDVVVHCRGGLGRAGTIAARLLVELGADPVEAIGEVRYARSPYAIETAAQERHVLGGRAVPERQPETTEAAARDRAVGAMLGLAVGDALGTTLEFAARDSA
jgi:ADP-ribosyl-[dinitrogen reductase] hydrolase